MNIRHDAASIAKTENGKVYRILGADGLWFKVNHGLVNLETGQLFMSGVSNFVSEVTGYFRVTGEVSLDPDAKAEPTNG